MKALQMAYLVIASVATPAVASMRSGDDDERRLSMKALQMAHLVIAFVATPAVASRRKFAARIRDSRSD
jgi:hypothetical protein